MNSLPLTDELLSDEALLRAHVAGVPDAFGVLVERHGDRLWTVAVRTLGNREDAADALQEALISAFRRAHTFRGGSAVLTWLHRIVINACLDLIRRKAVRAALPLPEDLDRRPEVGFTSEDPAEAAERHDDVTAALATLGPDQRAAVVLVDMLGYSVADAAETLGCPAGTVKSRCARARAALAPLLAAYRPGTESRTRASNRSETEEVSG